MKFKAMTIKSYIKMKLILIIKIILINLQIVNKRIVVILIVWIKKKRIQLAMNTINYKIN